MLTSHDWVAILHAPITHVLACFVLSVIHYKITGVPLVSLSGCHYDESSHSNNNKNRPSSF